MTNSLRAQIFITAAELAAQLDGLRPPVLLDVRNENGIRDGRPLYEKDHIPSSVYVDLPTELQGIRKGLSGARPLPDIADLEQHARRWGINAGTNIVVYDDVFGTKAGRAWFVLRWAGIDNVRLLDGGFAAWRRAGYPTTTDIPEPSFGDVRLTPGHLEVIEADEVERLAEQGALYDARTYEQFKGSESEGAGRSGHIPGAIAAPTRENLTEDGLLRGESELRGRFASLGIDGSQSIGVYCGGGVAAAHELAVLTSLGLPARLFVGSFSAWSSDEARPVAIGL